MTGRKREFKLYPFSFKELSNHTSAIEESRMLEHRLIYGYYPEVVTSPGEEKDVLKDQINSYLYKDVMEENNIAPVSLRSPEELGHMWENFIIAERIKRNEYAGRTFVKHYFWRTQQKKVNKRVNAPVQFIQAYPDAQFECITPENLTEFLY